MGKYLKLGTDPAAQSWLLPDHADPEKLRDEIGDAMAEENVVRVPVVVGKQTTELLVNGAACPAALVWEDAPSGGGMTIID